MNPKAHKSSELMNPANIVTFARISILFVFAFLINTDIQWIRIASIGIIPLLFYMDSLDGYLARTLNCATKFGSVLDVVGDRIVENVLWLLLAYLHIIPFWIPVIVIMRGFLTDGFRSVALAEGYTTFAMMKSKIGWWLVASPASRTSYAILKAVMFTVGLAIWSFKLNQNVWLLYGFYALVALTVIQCLIRGIFAVKECAKPMLNKN